MREEQLETPETVNEYLGTTHNIRLSSETDGRTCKPGSSSSSTHHHRFLISTTSRPAGSVIFENDALCFSALTSDLCHGCLLPPSSSSCLKKCTHCRKALYCSVSCQKINWNAGYKYLCKLWKSGNDMDRDFELALKLEIQYMNRNIIHSTFVHLEVASNLVTLETHISIHSPDQYLKFQENARRCTSILYPQLHDESEISEAVRRIILHQCRIHGNAYSAQDVMSLTSYAEGFFPLGGLLNHSCNPTCIAVYRGKTQIVRSIQNLDHYSEITVSYVDPILDRNLRRKTLFEKYAFWCECERCHEEQDLSILDSLIHNPSHLHILDNECDLFRRVQSEIIHQSTGSILSFVKYFLKSITGPHSHMQSLQSICAIMKQNLAEIKTTNPQLKNLSFETYKSMSKLASLLTCSNTLALDKIITSHDQTRFKWRVACICVAYNLCIMSIVYHHHHYLIGQQLALLGTTLNNAMIEEENDLTVKVRLFGEMGDGRLFLLSSRKFLEFAIQSLEVSCGRGLGVVENTIDSYNIIKNA